MLILLGLENFKIKKELISLFLVPGRGKGVRMDYEALSWWNFKTENQQTSLIGFTLDFCICCHQSLTQLLGWIMKLFPSMQGKESANFNPGSTSNMLTKVYRVAFCSCNLLNPLEVVICKFWVNYTTNSWKRNDFLFWAAAYWSMNPAAIIFEDGNKISSAVLSLWLNSKFCKYNSWLWKRLYQEA